MQQKTQERYLDMAVLIERNGRDFYHTMSRKFERDEEVSRIFDRLASDEAMHEAQFREIAAGHAVSAPLDDDAMQYLRATSISRFFAADFMQKAETEVKKPQDALMLAFRFEKATLLFYGAMEALHESDDALKEIIGAERRHLFQLMKVILSDARFRGLADAW